MEDIIPEGPPDKILYRDAPCSVLIKDVEKVSFPWRNEFARIDHWDYSNPRSISDPSVASLVTDEINREQVRFIPFRQFQDTVQDGKKVRIVDTAKIGISSKAAEALRWPLNLAEQNGKLQEEILQLQEGNIELKKQLTLASNQPIILRIFNVLRGEYIMLKRKLFK